MKPSPTAPENAPQAPEHSSKEEEIFQVRVGKADALRQGGINPYGNGYQPDTLVAELQTKLGALATAPEVEQASGTYRIAGRIMNIKSFGKAAFINVRDRSTDKPLQVWVKKDVLGDQAMEVFSKFVDLGDVVGAEGSCTRTKTGELTLIAKKLTPLTKSLRPLPDKWHGLADIETRCRQRYLDLIVTEGVKDIFVKRHKLVRTIQRFLDDRGFIEVETPTLHKPEEAGGAAARPFETHHNALDLELKMRIATELHLKRLVVGGLERVYEIGRIWRNEGIDRRHNPEFTSIEFYMSYATWEDLMKLTEELFEKVAVEVTGGTDIEYQGQKISLKAPFPRVSMVDMVARATGLSAADTLAGKGLKEAVEKLAEKEQDKELASILHHAATKSNPGDMISRAFEAVGEPNLPKDRPAFVIDFPAEVSPLARRRDADPRLTDRFELFVAGMELANAFSELNDPIDQRERFKQQVELAKKGDHEAMPYDEDFVRALEHGMPPTAGEGIGIDRLIMLLTNSASIRDVILFPLLKPTGK